MSRSREGYNRSEWDLDFDVTGWTRGQVGRKIGRCRVAAMALCTVAMIYGCGGAKNSASPTSASGVSAVPSPGLSASSAATAVPSPTGSSPAPAVPSPSATEPSWSTLSVSKPINVVAPFDQVSIVAWHGEYVAVGEPVDNAIPEVATSRDLIHWKIVASGDKAPFAIGLLVGPTGLLVAPGPDRIWTSVDAITWTPVSNLPFQPSMVKLSAGPRGLVAATVNTNLDEVWFSADGSAWVSAPSADSLLEGNTTYDVFAGPTGFFITGEIGRASGFENSAGNWAGWWSPDGLIWQRATIAAATDFGGSEEVHFASKGMLIEERGLGQWHSNDGQSWVKTPDAMTLEAQSADSFGITYIDGGDRTIAVDCSGACNRAWETFDGSTWMPMKITIPKSDLSAVQEMLPNSVFAAFTPGGITLYCSEGGILGQPLVAKVIRIAAAP